MNRLIVKWRDGHCNLAITHITRVGDVIEVYRNDEFVGLFDLGSIDAFWISNKEDRNEEAAKC